MDDDAQRVALARLESATERAFLLLTLAIPVGVVAVVDVVTGWPEGRRIGVVLILGLAAGALAVANLRHVARRARSRTAESRGRAVAYPVGSAAVAVGFAAAIGYAIAGRRWAIVAGTGLAAYMCFVFAITWIRRAGRKSQSA